MAVRADIDPYILFGRADLVRSPASACGFQVEPHHNPRLQGRHVQNICNLGRSGRGVQLELSRGLRSSLFLDHNSPAELVATPRLQVFAEAVRLGIQARYAGTHAA